MANKVFGKTTGLSNSAKKRLLKLYERSSLPGEIVSFELARELYELSRELGRKIGLLIGRRSNVEAVVVGDSKIVFLPDLGRFRFGKGRLRRLRLILSDFGDANSAPEIASDTLADLEKLRLDMVAAVRFENNRNQMTYAHITPTQNVELSPVKTEVVRDYGSFDFDFLEFIEALEEQLDAEALTRLASDREGAVLVSVRRDSEARIEASVAELEELARTAGVEVLDVVTQRRDPDPKTVLGRGKLEDVILRCLRLGATALIFDCELKPYQWRIITNSTELKVLDRSMLILDIFAQRATSSTGRLQVELAQLRYNLPRLVEKDAGLSRLTGGIGGRGPGETKLEIGRRRIRDRITRLEKDLKTLGDRRRSSRQRRRDGQVRLCAIVGYTNAGKSTLFNAITKGDVLSEDKLFATLETTKRRVSLAMPGSEDYSQRLEFVLSDTVGFIRDLPAELERAFEATLDELHEADLLLHVLDASEEDLERRIAAVEEVIERLGLADVPQIRLLNKADLLEDGARETLEREFEALPVSAVKRTGFDALFAEIAEQLPPVSYGKPQEASSS